MANDRSTIERLALSGFKSIRHADIELGKLNVLIGAKEAGKANIVSFMLRGWEENVLGGGPY